MPFKANADRRHHIPKQKRKVTNWATEHAREGAYDASQGRARPIQRDDRRRPNLSQPCHCPSPQNSERAEA
ncbi:MAG: hypothetical protein QOD93_780 [Acetobacteraceae bacterium]|nr:hypothetical protein [Acetobacteraceae bacterium]